MCMGGGIKSSEGCQAMPLGIRRSDNRGVGVLFFWGGGGGACWLFDLASYYTKETTPDEKRKNCDFCKVGVQ